MMYQISECVTTMSGAVIPYVLLSGNWDAMFKLLLIKPEYDLMTEISL